MKTEVSEIVGRCDVEFGDPSVGKEPDDSEETYQTESCAKQGRRCAIYRTMGGR